MSGSMRTVDHPDARSYTLAARLKRNWALGKRILHMLWFYFTEGRRVRRAYGACEREGSIYWVDRPQGKR